MAQASKTTAKAKKRYWTTPKIPVSFRFDKDLVDEAKAAAKAERIPFAVFVSRAINVALGKKHRD